AAAAGCQDARAARAHSPARRADAPAQRSDRELLFRRTSRSSGGFVVSAGIVSEVVLVARDAPMWLAACVLQQALGPAGVKITAVELPSRLHAADVYATLPALEPLHTRLKIDESQPIRGTAG